MRKSSMFWGALLVAIGVLLTIGQFVDFNVWSLIWPSFLVLLGAWMIWGVLSGPRAAEVEEVTIPLEGAEKARVRIRHGAGRLSVGGGAGPGELVSGTFGGGVQSRVSREGDSLDVELRMRSDDYLRFAMPWTWGQRGASEWDLTLSKEVPLSLDLESGASDSSLDLSELQVIDLKVATGASATDLVLPANAGHTRVKVGSGLASVKIRIPAGVAARIRVESGLAGITVDRDRFPRVGNEYLSPDYDTAANKVDLDIETGVGSVDIR